MLPQNPSNASDVRNAKSNSCITSRRRFLTATVSAVGLGTLMSQGRALAEYYEPIDFELTGDHEWTNEYNRLSIIKQAMWIIDRRFLDIENVVQNVLDLPTSRNGYSFQPGAWDNLRPHYPALQNGDHLLNYQLLTLRKWTLPPDARSSPKLYIHSTHSSQNAFAWGPYNTVTVEGDAKNYEVSGHFAVYLNFRYLGASGLNSDPWIWAATIAHEMLHNLGHMHPENVNDPKYERRQINAFTAALYYGNRRYRYGMRTRDVRCGGRRP
jgi:hypothetical protein